MKNYNYPPNGYSYKIDDVDLNYAELTPEHPVSVYGLLRWELQIETNLDKAANEWRKHHLSVSEDDDGAIVCNLQRLAFTEEGEQRTPVRVYDHELNKIDMSDTVIGTGSRGNVILWINKIQNSSHYLWNISLEAVQVTYLKDDAFIKEFKTEKEYEPVVYIS